jgi:Ala-tRNA(Pro) deacylase
MTTHAAPQRLIQQLDAASVAYELIDHRRTTSAAAEARALGLEPHEVAKTVVLVTPLGFVRAVLPASARLDLHKVGEFLDTKDVRLASEEVLVGAYPEFELGAVPPLAGDSGDRVLVDPRLRECEWVVLEAGTHEQSVRLRTDDLVAVSGGQLADISED